MTALPNKCYSGCHKATEEDGNRETPGKESWRGKCGQQASGLDGDGSTRQSWVETSHLWPVLHWKRQGISQLKS